MRMFVMCVGVAAVGLAVGCAKNSEPPTTTGRVTFEGNPAPRGFVRFLPATGELVAEHPPTADVSDGTFTTRPKSPLTPGRYRAMVMLGDGLDAEAMTRPYGGDLGSFTVPVEVPADGTPLVIALPPKEEK